MNDAQIESILQKVIASPNKVYTTKVFQYWLNGEGQLCRARLSDLDTMAMYEPGAIEILR